MSPDTTEICPAIERHYVAQPATVANMTKYGMLLEPAEDGVAFGSMDTVLHLSWGHATVLRHEAENALCGSDPYHAAYGCNAGPGVAHGKRWHVLLGPPDAPDFVDALPDISRLQAFCITGSQALVLHRSTWHAGPCFFEDKVDFVNLELGDTNLADHHTVRLDKALSVIARIVI